MMSVFINEMGSYCMTGMNLMPGVTIVKFLYYYLWRTDLRTGEMMGVGGGGL